jgi:seryl-tRNA synthetase
MLDIQFIRENPKLVEEKSAQKNVKVDISKLLELDESRRDLLVKVENLRAERNRLNAEIKGKPTDEQIKSSNQHKEELSGFETNLKTVDQEYQKLIRKVPNMPKDDVPVGATEAENVVVKTWGEQKKFDYKPKTHWEIAEPRGLIDKERAAKVSGSRFAYLKGGIARLQFALIQYVMDTLGDETIIAKLISENNLNLVPKPFIPVIPPTMLKTDIYEATGRLKAEETTYKLADDDLWMIASGEHSVCSMYYNEIIDEADLPIRYLAYNTNYRREAGTYGKDTNGIIRLHQFDKLEMEVFSTPETSLDEHLLLVAVQEYLVQQLGLHYQLILKCTADIGDPNARGVDIDTWLPGEGAYKETHTADLMTDYQARDLKTRVRRKAGEVEFLHTNDATAFALGRILAAIIENYQTEDGHIEVPSVLKSYFGSRELI